MTSPIAVEDPDASQTQGSDAPSQTSRVGALARRLVVVLDSWVPTCRKGSSWEGYILNI